VSDSDAAMTNKEWLAVAYFTFLGIKMEPVLLELFVAFKQ
jgi:hypothetical protein